MKNIAAGIIAARLRAGAIICIGIRDFQAQGELRIGVFIIDPVAPFRRFAVALALFVAFRRKAKGDAIGRNRSAVAVERHLALCFFNDDEINRIIGPRRRERQDQQGKKNKTDITQHEPLHGGINGGKPMVILRRKEEGLPFGMLKGGAIYFMQMKRENLMKTGIAKIRLLSIFAAIMTIAVVLSTVPFTASAQDSNAAREITQVNGNLYLFRNNSHLAAFLVTSEGIIATDPINAEAAKWLKSEVKQRFGKEIRIVIYSHSDRDHVAGGEVYQGRSNDYIAHENAVPHIEAGDYTAVPDKTFSTTKTVRLGDGEVKLHFFGVSHTDNVIVMEFTKERAIFVVDSLNINRLPYRNLPRFYMPETIEFMKKVEELDFDIAIPGHGPIGEPKDVTRYREYLEALYEAVLDARASGKSLEEAQSSIQLEDFAGFGNYESWLPLNIEGVYRILDEAN